MYVWSVGIAGSYDPDLPQIVGSTIWSRSQLILGIYSDRNREKIADRQRTGCISETKQDKKNFQDIFCISWGT